MGMSCCKCCKCCKSEKEYKQLNRASTMTKTSTKQNITQTIITRLSTKEDLKAILKQKGTSDELKKVLTPPFSRFDSITENLFLTSTGGMIKENILGKGITCIINTTFEAPNYQIKNIQCFRIPVNIY